MSNDIVEKVFGWFLVVVVIILTALWVFGCQTKVPPPYNSDPNKPSWELTQDEIDTIFTYKDAEAELAAKDAALADLRAFRVQMLWLVVGAGALAIFWKPAIGMPLGILFAAMISFAQWLMDYSLQIGWISMGLGVIMVGYVIWLKHDELFKITQKSSVVTTALREVVTGVEEAKGISNNRPYVTFKDIVKETQASVQSPTTTELVSAIRETL